MSAVTDLAGLSKSKREAGYEELWIAAIEAGNDAAAATKPAAMIVQQRVNPLDDSSEVVREYAPIADGVCGFAWITITPATSSFARWLKREKGGRRGYYGGLEITAPSLGTYGQSYELKSAWAAGVARCLREAGVNAYPGGRLD